MPELTDAQKVIRNSTGLACAAALEAIAAGVLANTNLGIVGAAVGDIAMVTAVDANGKPTAWKPVPLPANSNMLKNWYFVGGGSQLGYGTFPINQHGQGSYSTNTAWAIDRWRTRASAVLTLTADGLKTTNFVYQYLENPAALLGKTVTLSALLSDGLLTLTATLPNTVPGSATGFGPIESGAGYINLRILSDGNIEVILSINRSTAESYALFKAVKLELGTEQTLAHREGSAWVLNELPDYGAELLSCQRYFQRFVTQSLRPTHAEDCRPVMAKEPTADTMSLGGTTYYTLSAE